MTMLLGQILSSTPRTALSTNLGSLYTYLWNEDKGCLLSRKLKRKLKRGINCTHPTFFYWKWVHARLGLQCNYAVNVERTYVPKVMRVLSQKWADQKKLILLLAFGKIKFLLGKMCYFIVICEDKILWTPDEFFGKKSKHVHCAQSSAF